MSFAPIRAPTKIDKWLQFDDMDEEWLLVVRRALEIVPRLLDASKTSMIFCRVIFSLFVLVLISVLSSLVSLPGCATASFIRYGVRGAVARRTTNDLRTLPAHQGESQDARVQGNVVRPVSRE